VLSLGSVGNVFSNVFAHNYEWLVHLEALDKAPSRVKKLTRQEGPQAGKQISLKPGDDDFCFQLKGILLLIF
jgi:hypothetical protein